MALLTPTWLQNGTYTARLDRIFSDVLLTEGVIRPGAGALLVTQRGAGTNNSVDIAAGYAVITGDDTADQGNYLIRNDATVNLAATAAPVSNSRPHLVAATGCFEAAPLRGHHLAQGSQWTSRHRSREGPAC